MKYFQLFVVLSFLGLGGCMSVNEDVRDPDPVEHDTGHFPHASDSAFMVGAEEGDFARTEEEASYLVVSSEGNYVVALPTSAGETTQQGTPAALGSSASALTASYNSVTVPYRGWTQYSFSKLANTRYTICSNPSSGDADLFTHYSGAPTLTSSQFKSEHSGLTDDCVGFLSSQTGPYFIGLYGYLTGTVTNLWIADSPIQSAPPAFQGKLSWPTPSCNTPAAGAFFNTTWGNSVAGNDPFFPGSKNQLHAGEDVACSPGTAVYAPCNGTVVKNGWLGNAFDGLSWGDYTVVQCTLSGVTISYGVDHITNYLPLGTSVIAGQTVIGNVFAMAVNGEVPHVHNAIRMCDYAACYNAGQQPQVGALNMNIFPGMARNPGKDSGFYK